MSNKQSTLRTSMCWCVLVCVWTVCWHSVAHKYALRSHLFAIYFFVDFAFDIVLMFIFSSFAFNFREYSRNKWRSICTYTCSQ